jgi:hypothetical protein
MWSSAAPPEVEAEKKLAPAKPAPAPRQPTASAKPTPTKPVVAAPGLLQRLTSQQKILFGAGVGVLLLIILLIAFWPKVPPPTAATTVQPTAAQPAPEPVTPPAPVVVATGSLSVQTNVDSVDVFIDKDPKRVTNGKQLQLTLPAGDHTVRVSKDEYNQLPAKQVHINKDQFVPVSFTLVELTGNPGFLEITSAPGAAVRVDGQSWGAIGADGKLRVQVDPKPTYLIQIQAGNSESWMKTVGPVKADQTLAVAANLILKALPTVDLFTGQTEVTAGQTIRIAWATTHAKSVDIENLGQNLSPTGAKDVTVTQDTIYTLIAKGEGGSSSPKTLSVTVKAAPLKAPSISSFTPSAARIKQGESVVLTWSTNDATSTTINGSAVTPAASGSISASPTETTTYTLAAIGAGNPAKLSVTVTVDPKVQPPPSLLTPTSNDAAAIRTALDRLSGAYATQLPEEVRKQWTGMNKDQEKAVKAVFQNSGVKAIAMVYDSCGNPAVNGDTATISCTETMSYTADNKRQSRAGQVNITLKKSGSEWKVSTKFGK